MTLEQEKTREDLSNHLNRSPFAPFSIRMSDGSTFEIVRRYQAAIGLTKGTVVSADGRASRNFHVKEILAVQDVAVA